MVICAATAYSGDYKITVSGSRPGGAPTQAVLRTFVSSALGAGEIGFFPSLLLTERGLPLRGAKVTARITGPSEALGTLVAQGTATARDIAALIASNGDLSPGQAKAELLPPASLPGTRPLPLVTLADDSTNGDFEPQDGVYIGQFLASIPGVYSIDLHAEYTCAFGGTGIIEDRLVTQVVVGDEPGCRRLQRRPRPHRGAAEPGLHALPGRAGLGVEASPRPYFTRDLRAALRLQLQVTHSQLVKGALDDVGLVGGQVAAGLFAQHADHVDGLLGERQVDRPAGRAVLVLTQLDERRGRQR